MGARPYYELNVWPQLDMTVEAVARPPSSSPSVGTAKRHTEEQRSLMAAAFASARDRTAHDY